MTSFATPKDVADAYYQAFSARKLEPMMAVWAEDEEIICIHPGHAPLYGYEAVRASWAKILAFDSAVSTVERMQEKWLETVGLTIQTLVEWINVRVNDEEMRKVPIAVSNTFIRTPQGWRMLSHHASPMPGVMAESMQIAEAMASGKRVLH